MGTITMQLHGSHTAFAEGLTFSTRKGSVVFGLARLLLQRGLAQATDQLEVFRDGTPVFKPATVGAFALLSVTEPDGESVKIIPYRDKSHSPSLIATA